MGFCVNEKGAKAVKKVKIKLSNGHNNQKSDAVRKRGSASGPQRTGDGLTCNEAQVEALLSEGEST